MAWNNQLDMGAPVAMTQNIFDSRRDAVLISEFPSIRDAPHTSTSVTKSRHRMRWRTLHRWNTFENDVINYFITQFTVGDRQSLIMSAEGLRQLFASVNNRPANTEEQVKAYLLQFVMEVHNIAARGENGAPLPSDFHASIVRVAAGAGNYGLVGIPDFAMYHGEQQRICLLGEAKNPWNVTPQQITEVLNGTFSVVSD